MQVLTSAMKRSQPEDEITEAGDPPSSPPPLVPSCCLNHTKPITDPKLYRRIRLANGLESLLVSDTRTSGVSGQQVNVADAKDGDDEWVEAEEQDEDDCYDEEDEERGDEDSFYGLEQGGLLGEDTCEILERACSSASSTIDEEADDHDTYSSGSEGRARGILNNHHQHHHHHHHSHHPGSVRMAGAAMAVEVGSFQDPPTLQGLAHYLEHMLFMGSDKYPSENAYDAYVSSGGGSSNAYTECEYTVYHFEIPFTHLKEALDVFAQFFISPLMRAEASARELQSIESEFNLSSTSDTCRVQQVICETCRPGHPFSQFTWGNLQSLRDIPHEAGVDTASELRQFFKQHYIAGVSSW